MQRQRGSFQQFKEMVIWEESFKQKWVRGIFNSCLKNYAKTRDRDCKRGLGKLERAIIIKRKRSLNTVGQTEWVENVTTSEPEKVCLKQL